MGAKNPERRREIEIKNRNKPESKLRRNEYQKRKMKNHIPTRIKCNLSKRIRQAVKSQSTNKKNKTSNLIGCSVEFFKNYLESKFQSGMNWNNYGEWEIDHIIPCVAFDLTKTEEQYRCFHYSNMQPLWAHDNYTKNDKLPNGESARRLKNQNLINI